MIDRFAEEWGFLSNFAACTVSLSEVDYPTVEHAYQAAKTTNREERKKILMAATPGQAKRLGGLVTLRPDWNNIRLEVMTTLVRRKFQNPALREMLLATGDRPLIEGNNWGDRFWGCTWNGTAWVGENHLGRILMQIREELR